MTNSRRLIVTYTPNSYWADVQDNRFFIITHNDLERSEEVREVADAATLESEALALLNEDCQPEVDGVYLPENGIEKYFTDVSPIQDLPGCYVGNRSEKKFIILPRHIIEYDALEKDDYYPLMFAHLYPPEEEEMEMLTLLREMMGQETGQ